METLEKIAPNPVRLDVGGERLEIKHLSLELLPAFMAVATPILNELMQSDVMRAVGLNLAACQKVAAMLSGRDASWVARQSFKDQVSIFVTCMEANTDFFAAEVVPGMLATLTGMTSFVCGLTRSMASSQQDMTDATS